MSIIRSFVNTPARSGLAAGFGAFALWGFVFPVYIKTVSAIDPLEVVAHRVVWTVVMLTAGLAAWRGVKAFGQAITGWAVVRMLAVTAVLITINWLVFIWAVMNGRVVEASLGYYINPLVNVLLGLVFLGERLTRRQMVAVGLAVTGVACLVIGSGRLPWVSLVLPLSFGFYGVLRKRIAIEPVMGLLVETALVLPFALVYLLWWRGTTGAFATVDATTDVLLVLAGPMTFVPLILFLFAARRLRYATVGLMQYITPTGQFLLGVYLYGEPFSAIYGLAFAFIWLALVVYSTDGLWPRPRKRD